MDTKSVLNIATLKPEDAAKAIADAALVGVTPDEYNASKESLSPIVEQRKNPATLNRTVASAIGNSETKASLVKEDLSKLNAFDKFTTYFSETIADVDRRRKVVGLANKKRRSGGVLSFEEDLSLNVAREELEVSGKLLQSADYNMLESVVPKATGAAWDMVKGAWDNFNIVGTGAAVGAATGLPSFMGGPLAGTVGTLVGAARGAGFAYGVASIKDSYEQTSGSMYNDLDTAKRPDGTDLNLPEIEKDNISTGLGLLSGSLDGISNIYMVGKALPGLKKLLNPKRVVDEVVKEAVVDTAVKKGFTTALSRLGKVANTIGAVEASTEAVQEMMSIVAEEMGQTFDGSETSLTKALNNISTKLETSETFRSQTASRVGEAALVGAVTDRIVTIGGKVVSKPVEGAAKGIIDTLVKKPTNYVQPEGVATSEVPATREQVSDVIQVTPAGSGLTGVESMQLHVALMAGNKALADAKAQNVSEIEFRKIQQKMLDDNGLSFVWVDPDKLNQELDKLPADKRTKIANILDPSGAFSNELNGPIKLDSASMMRAIQEQPELGNLIKKTPESPSSGDYLKTREAQDAIIEKTLNEAGMSSVKTLVAEGAPQNLPDGEHDYVGQPIADLPDVNDEYTALKAQLDVDVIGNLNRETEMVIDHNQRVSIETDAMSEIQRAEANPEVKMVDLYLQTPDQFKVDVNTLSPEQRTKARNLPYTAERGYITETGGRDALTVARELGFANVDQMIRSLGTVESTDQLNEQAQRIQSEIRQINQKPPTYTEAPQVGTLKKLADNMMKASVTFMNKVYEMGQNNSRLDVSQEQAQMQAEASEAIRFTQVKDLDPGQFRQGQAKSRKLGNDAVKAKDYKGAAKYFRAEAYNTALIANTISAIEQANQYFRNIKRFMQPEMLKTMQKAGKEFTNGYADLMQVFAVVDNNIETRSFDNYLKLVDYLKRNGQTGIEIPDVLLQKLSDKTDLKEFTVEELKYVSDTLDAIEHLANNKDLLYSEIFAKNQMNRLKKIVDITVGKLKAHFDYDPGKLLQSQGDLSMGVKVGQWLANFETNVDNIVYLTKRLNGKDPDEIFTKLIYDPLAGTGAFANTGLGVAGGNVLRKAVRDRIVGAAKKFDGGFFKALTGDAFADLGNTPVYVPEFAQAVKLNNGNLTKKQLLNMAVYYGTVEGRKRLENFGISSDVIFEVLKRELGTKGFDFVQEAVWDTYESMKERSFQVERTTLGIDPKEVKALEFEVDGKKYRGGYAPLKYRVQLELGDTNSKLEKALEVAVGNEQAAYENQNAAKGMTDRGYLEARVKEYDGVLDISSNLIERGFEEHITDISMRIPLMDVMKLLKDERLAKEISSVIGIEGYNSLVNHVIAMTKTNQMVTMELMARSERSLNKVANMLKNNLSASYVALNPSSILMSFASIPTAWSKMGFTGGSYYLARTLFHAATHPWQIQTMRDLANEIVPSLKDHVMDVSDTLLGGISDAMPKEYFGGTSKIAKYTGFNLFRRAMDTVVNKVGFKIGLGQMDYSIKAIFTVAMYRQFRDGGVAGWPKSKLDAMSPTEAHQAAVSYVNNSIVSTLPTANTLERARVQKAHPLIAMFWNDLRNVLNHVILKHREIGWDAKQAVQAFQDKDYEKGIRSYADATSNYMNLLVMSSLAAAITSWARGRATGEEEEDRESILTAKGIDQFGFEFASILTSPEAFVQLYGENFLKATPWLRHVVDAIEGQIQGNRYRQTVSTPLTAAGTEFAVFAGAIAQWMQTPPDEEFEFSPKQLNAAIRSASFATPFPANAVIKFMKAVEENEETKLVGEPTIGVEMIGQLNAFIQMYRNSEVPETKELVKEAEQIVQDLGPKTQKMSNNAIANDILAGTQSPIDPAVYGWIRFLESGMNDEAQPVKKDSRGRIVYEKDSKGDIVKDVMGNPVPETLSSAYGRYQMTDDTWNAIVDQAGSILGLTDKTDPEQQEIAMDYLVRQNANILTTKGIPVTAETIYSAHYQGPQVAAKIYDPEVNPLAPFKSVFPDSGPYSFEKVLSANPWLRTIKTVGQYRRYIQTRMAKGRKGYENWLEDNLKLD